MGQLFIGQIHLYDVAKQYSFYFSKEISENETYDYLCSP